MSVGEYQINEELKICFIWHLPFLVPYKIMRRVWVEMSNNLHVDLLYVDTIMEGLWENEVL